MDAYRLTLARRTDRAAPTVPSTSAASLLRRLGAWFDLSVVLSYFSNENLDDGCVQAFRLGAQGTLQALGSPQPVAGCHPCCAGAPLSRRASALDRQCACSPPPSPPKRTACFNGAACLRAEDSEEGRVLQPALRPPPLRLSTPGATSRWQAGACSAQTMSRAGLQARQGAGTSILHARTLRKGSMLTAREWLCIADVGEGRPPHPSSTLPSA